MRVLLLTSSTDLADRPDTADTLVQAEEIAQCLAELGHQRVTASYGDARVGMLLADFNPHVVFNLVEDVLAGPDRVHEATTMLDRRDLPYTGATTESLRALANKTLMKALLKAAGLPVAAGVADADPATRFIVKSAVEHASVGLTAENVVTGPASAMLMIAKRQAEFGGEWFAEAYIDGREFNVALLERQGKPTVLPIAEILFADHPAGKPRILGYAEKWDDASTAFAATPRVFPAREHALFAQLEDLALRAWRFFALNGYARVDFRVDEWGNPVILEINANPCLSANAGYCAAAANMGLSQIDVIAAIVAAAR